MKSKKAELGVGVIVVAAIAIIVGLILFQAAASNVEQATQTVTGVSTLSQGQYTGVLNTPVELVGQELISVIAVTNRSSGAAIAAANYTIYECVRNSDNLKGICYKALGAGLPSASAPVNISYTYYPNGYIDDAGSRSIAGIIILLAAIAIALVLIPYLRYD